MTKHFELEIEKLKNKVLTLGSKVEEALSIAIDSIINRKLLAANDIKTRDRIIDQLEVEIEEDCLKVLALHQPVASDLRFVVAVLKLNNDLERIGDLAVSIAFRAKPLVETQPAQDLFNLQIMAEKSQAMLHRSLEALINLDLALANKVCSDDDEIDKLNAEIFKLIEQAKIGRASCRERV